METSEPDADCDLKFLDISEMLSLWITKHIAEHITATAAACYANIQGINEKRCLELREIERYTKSRERFLYAF